MTGAGTASCPFCFSRAVREVAHEAGRTRTACERCAGEWETVRQHHQDPGRAGVQQSASPVWRIVRTSGHEVECYVAYTRPELWTLTVAFCHETLLRESLPTQEDALERAEALQKGLARHGWRQA